MDESGIWRRAWDDLARRWRGSALVGLALGLLLQIAQSLLSRDAEILDHVVLFFGTVGVVATAVFVFGLIRAPFNQRNEARTQLAGVLGTHDDLPSFSLSAGSISQMVKRVSVDLTDEEWIPDDSMIFTADGFRITNKTSRPLQLFVFLKVPQKSRGPVLISGAWRDISAYRLYADPETSVIKRMHYLNSPIRLPPRETVSGILLFVDWMGSRDQYPEDRIKTVLQLRDYASDSIWEIPVPEHLTADELDQYRIQEAINS